MTGSAPPRRWLAGDAAPLLVTTILSALGAVMVTWPLARDMGRATLRSGEVLLTAWQLNWYHQALLTSPLAWADANIFFPYDRSATYNDLLLTHAMITLPVAWAESPVLALNVALVGGIVLCGVCAHLLIHELVADRWAATIGGTLFALTPFRFLHLGHVSIAAAWPIPLFFWALLRHLRQPSWTRAAVAALCGTAVGLSSLYHAAYVAPIAPLVLILGARRGAGGRRTWLPLLPTGLAGVGLLVWFLMPFAVTLRTFGVAAAPDDLLRYGADLSSLARRPDDLSDSAVSGIDPEAYLYPGAALLWLSAAGAVTAAASVRTLHAWWRWAAVAVLALVMASAIGFVIPLAGIFSDVWALAVLALIWLGPVALAIWAIAGLGSTHAAGPAIAIRIGLAGAALAFVLALGPQARYLTQVIGPAPYWLLVQASAAFEGTRVPARYGGIAILFLAVLAAGVLAAMLRDRRRVLRLTGAGAALAAVAGSFVELPFPPLPRGHELVALPRLRDPAYRWIAGQPGRFGILELPDWSHDADVHYRHREWRSLRHMLASKQHGQHLVNGTGRIEPFLWQRFRWLQPWSDEFFTYISAYFPIEYVLVHEDGLPLDIREAVWSRLDGGLDGWRQVFRSPRIRVYTIDRSGGRGAILDRLYLRRDLTPEASITFAARVRDAAGSAEARAAPGTLELLQDDQLIGSWPVEAEWRRFETTVQVPEIAAEQDSGWPRSGTLLRWRLRDPEGAALELRNLSAERTRAPRG